MKKYFLVFLVVAFVVGCQEEAVKKPKNLIPTETMVDIIYDLSILQSMRNSHQNVLDSSRINPETYIYKKYKIDSLQFAKSNQYYAADNIKEYEKLYQKVNDRLLKEKNSADTLVNNQNSRLKNQAIKASKTDSVQAK